MNKEEFLIKQTHDVIEIFEKYGSYRPTFAILYDDGSTDSFATRFEGSTSKENFDYFMRKLCTNPKAIASVFTSEGWLSEMAETENKRPSECDDKDGIIMLLYSTRDNIQEMRLYKPDKNRKLELINVSNNHHGRFSNPFLVPCLTKAEREKAINEFQEHIREALCKLFGKLNPLFPMLFFRTDTREQVSVQWITDEEWMNKNSLKQMIGTKCREHRTLAFILAIQVNSKMVNVILVAEKIQEVFCYRIDHKTNTMEFRSRGTYDGEFSELFKNKIQNYEN